MRVYPIYVKIYIKQQKIVARENETLVHCIMQGREIEMMLSFIALLSLIGIILNYRKISKQAIVNGKYEKYKQFTLFGGIYEIKLIPQEKGVHTLYMKGLQGELIAMQTRTDATLADNLTSPPTPFQKARGAVMQVIVYSKSMNRDSRNALLWMIVFAGVIIAGISLAKIKNDYGFGLRLASSVTMLSILFTFANCNLFQSSKGGNEPWTLFIPGNTSKTQSVNGGTTYHGGGNGFATGVIPVTGMYFVHSDHLGSVTMLTDGYGNPVTGGEYGGKSYISYKPYGEILRTDSGGPDLSKFKYTGQEEDRESGLMYYKARYYDPYLARFLEADSVTNSNSLFGMNRYMYVEGNPVRFSDPTGHWKVSHITEGKWARNLGGGISLAMKAGDFRNYNFQNASGSTKGVSGGAEWASGGLSRSGNTANSLAGEEKYKGNDYKRSDFGQKVTLKMERWFYGQILNRHYADTYDKDKVVLITIGLWALKSCPQTQNKRRCEVLFSAVAWNYVKYIDDNINYSLFKNSDPIHTKNRTDDDMKEQVTIGYWSIPEKSLGVQAGGEQ